MEKVKKSLGSIMFSCTCNIVLALVGLYLLFLLLCVITDNWDTITTNIISFMATFIPFKDFLFEHLGKIFTGWVVLSLWLLCVFVKMEENEIKESKSLDFIGFLLFPIGSIILFMVPFKLGVEWFPINVISILAAFALSMFSIAILGVFFSEKNVEKSEAVEVSETDAPEQLELFDKKIK